MNYTPSILTIYSRAATLRILRDWDWPLWLIDSILIDDSPSVSLVWSLIIDLGQKEAKRRIVGMFT
jgi:hypothetical protein